MVFDKVKRFYVRTYMKVGTKVNFFSDTIITIIMKFQYIRFILPKVEIIFPQSLLHYQHTLSTFVRDAIYRSCKTLC